MSVSNKWISETESRLAKLESDLEKLRKDIAEDIKRTTMKLTTELLEYIFSILDATIACARIESSLRDIIVSLPRQMPHDYAVSFTRLSFTDIKNILLLHDHLEEKLREYTNSKNARDLRLTLEKAFSPTISWAFDCLMKSCSNTVGFEEFLSLSVDTIGAENVKRLLTPEDVLRAYGIEENNKFRDFLSK